MPEALGVPVRITDQNGIIPPTSARGGLSEGQIERVKELISREGAVPSVPSLPLPIHTPALQTHRSPTRYPFDVYGPTRG
jgi:hypothetical protein